MTVALRSDHLKCDLAGNAFAATCFMSVLAAVCAQTQFTGFDVKSVKEVIPEDSDAINLFECFNDARSQSHSGGCSVNGSPGKKGSEGAGPTKTQEQ